MTWRAGLDARCEHVNVAWLTFTGRALHEELGTGWEQDVHPEDLAARRARYLEHVQRRAGFETEYRLRRHDGVDRYVLERAVPYETADGAFAGFVGSCLDIDERHAREVVHNAEAFFEMALDPLCVAGLDGYFKRLNPAWTHTLQWSADELMSRPSIEFVHPEDRPHVLAARGRLREGVPLHSLANRYLAKDGTYRWLEWRSVAHLAQGLVYAAARDVTKEIEAQRALRDLTQNLTATLDSIADGVISIDAEAAIVRMNPVAEKLTGWALADARGKPLDQVFHIVSAETRLPTALLVERTLEQGIAVELSQHTLLLARGGAELPVASSCAPMRNPDRSVNGAVLVFRDLTRDKQAEHARDLLQRQLVHADRMVSVGTLAAGAAHEINNPLGYVTANLELILDELATPGAAAPTAEQLAAWTEMAATARAGAERISKIVRGLTTFSHAGPQHPEAVDVALTLEVSSKLAVNEMSRRARVVKDLGALPRVMADDAQLGQVFLNLLVNAAQAIPDGDSEGNEIRVVTTTDAQGRAVIEVWDTGSGIPPEVLGRVFEPFFTTKPIGVGTGLGLSICHNIVTDLGGEITVHRREPRGTIVRVALPPAPPTTKPVPLEVATVVPPTSRRCSVLIVDDERALGVALGRALRAHEVTVVTSAKEALDLVVSKPPFDVILSDLMMPGMSGMELYDEISRQRPEVAARMVFITGGVFTPEGIAFLDRVPNLRFSKPIGVAALRTLVDQSCAAP